MELAVYGLWLACAITVLGLVQWAKGMFPKCPSWVWGAVAASLCFVWAYSPDPVRIALGALSITQLGYETLMQPFKVWLANKSNTQNIPPKEGQ